MNTGAGILAKMTENNDKPLTPSTYTHYDNDGNPYSKGTIVVESCWGKKGLYIASNASGLWQVEGPFGR